MKKITVDASTFYDVLIEIGLMNNVGKYIAAVKPICKVAIISDSNVWPLYGDTVADSLSKEGYQVIHYVFPAGEASKKGSTYLAILEFLAQNQMTRTDLIVALGGGVVGDMAGFVAATYLRGIPFVQVPTTLLAMVDSSVGGKTAIDLATGKNLAGAFHQPILVLCDISALDSLGADTFRDGCAEVIKYGVLYDELLFSHLEHNGESFDRSHVIARCVELKRDVVAADEFDTGSRQMLNLGHTLGHSIESLSHFTVSHGQAVAIGIHIIAKAACHSGHCSQTVAGRVYNVLSTFKLPTSTAYTAQQLYAGALSDKKRAGSHVNLIIPKAIGQCVIHPVPISELTSFIEAGL